MSIHPHAAEYWMKMPTEKLQEALSSEAEDGGNSKVIRAILDTRNSSQIARAMMAVTESNRALVEEIRQIAIRNQSTSVRLGRITIWLSILATVTGLGAWVAILLK
jgi:hypothetical protein